MSAEKLTDAQKAERGLTTEQPRPNVVPGPLAEQTATYHQELVRPVPEPSHDHTAGMCQHGSVDYTKWDAPVPSTAVDGRAAQAQSAPVMAPTRGLTDAQKAERQ
jgi:hypothetical protein